MTTNGNGAGSQATVDYGQPYDRDVLQQWSRYITRYENDEDFIAQQIEQHIMVTSFDKLVGMVDQVYNWGRRSSLWPLQ